MLRILVIFSLALTLSAASAKAETLRITSYNTAMLQKYGVDFVPCTDERIAPQVDAVVNSPLIAPKNQNFAILLQEVWTRAAFSAYGAAAKKRGFYFTPTKYSEIKNNGQLIITNMKVGVTHFEPFKSESYAGRGIRTIEVETSRGPLLIANIHTSYSDANEFLPAHRAQIAQINEYLWPFSERESIIVGGDFNAGRNMAFHNGTYDPRSVIWDGAIAPAFEQLGMRVIGDADAITWDEHNNTLVSNPSTSIRIEMAYAHGSPSWDMYNSRLDNIFASVQMHEIQTGRTLLQKVRIAPTCFHHENPSNLSDHYGIYSVFSFDD